jgi:hypothetical protein
MILAIQTVRPEIEIMLFDDRLHLLAGRNWLSAKDEISRLLPEIEILIEPNGGWKKISKIVVFNGIGGFASTRIGVTVANTLAMAIGAELYEISLPEETAGSNPEPALNPDGGQRIAQAHDIAALVKKFFEGNPLPVKIAQPKYRSAPMISKSKKKKFN